MAKTENIASTEEKRFSKARIIKDGKFKEYTDIVSVVLEDDKKYSLTEVQAEIDKFLKRKVN